MANLILTAGSPRREKMKIAEEGAQFRRGWERKEGLGSTGEASQPKALTVTSA